MIVRRFVNWLRDYVATARATAATALRPGERPIERRTLLLGAVSNWLDNGRRLRPTVARTATPTVPTVVTAATARAEVHYETALSTSEEAFAVSQPSESTVKSQIVGSNETAAFSAPPAVVESSPSLLEGIEQLDATQRGLVYLKYLVRHGVYNEGYPTEELPSQYRHSAGQDESGDEQN